MSEFARAVARAKPVLRIGDKVRVRTCADGHSTYRMLGWGGPGGNWIEARTSDELHPYNVTRVNGVDIGFRDCDYELLKAGKAKLAAARLAQ